MPRILEPLIRREAPGDAAAIRRLNDAAFGQPEEGEIVDRLRQALAGGDEPWISLVAEIEGEGIVGHILFTEVEIRAAAGGEPAATAVGLAPMAVRPDLQRRGIGSRLVETGLAECRAAGHELVVVLGHPAYYPRFGFVAAAGLGLAWEGEAPSEAFMALELTAGAAASRGGVVSYRPEFG